MTHDTLVFIAKTFGLFYLMGFFLIVTVLVCRPSQRAAAEHAARSILEAEDRPCR
ncbi:MULTISPECIES: cbb3-type cytochrome c oxidase subunit 3 [unclassified Hoeflea]|jgi:cytochrome c oxidase cbb3-type subunit 4|uniref:cbb3-type cytochrome c oxidase subunit 3 n=1 Tax=unclassified Hoeflea TaxID=2614931 RepID=UPI002AFDFC73|nr:cbb3-type cytochrome c oxidase subunit 3 [Hoeflea sp.]